MRSRTQHGLRYCACIYIYTHFTEVHSSSRTTLLHSLDLIGARQQLHTRATVCYNAITVPRKKYYWLVSDVIAVLQCVTSYILRILH
jgi:hypothetical protein